MSETAPTSHCIICRKDSKNLVVDPGVEKICDILNYSRRLVDLGELQWKPLLEYLSSLSDSELKQVRYHSHCRKKVVNKVLLERAEKKRCCPENPLEAQPAKRGRPAKGATSSRAHRHIGALPKEKVCIFSPASGECKYYEELHRVMSDNRGQTLLDIKANTRDDHIRASLSSLHQPGDAHAQEKWYHSSCLQDALRTCPMDTEVGSANEDMRRAISDVQIVMYVKSLLMSESGLILNMAEVNNMYMSILKENNVTYLGDNQRKYLKHLLSDKIPHIKFVQPPQKNESERVLLSKSLGEAVDYASTSAPDIVLESLLMITRAMRAELLEHRKQWRFSGDGSLSDWQNPPLTKLFLTCLWYGTYGDTIGGKRDAESQKCVEIGCQFMVQNTCTDRQVKHKPKFDTGFVQRAETPLSVALPLTMYHRVRDKNLIRVLSSVYLGTRYEHLLDITKRIEHAVVLRMRDTGGYCLPDFIKKGITVFFAVDNIDFLEDTPYGQSTLHGTVVVVYQEEDKQAEPINSPLAIPDKAPFTPQHVKTRFKDEPVIQLKPIKFSSYNIGQRDAVLKPYNHYNATWALANHFANDADMPMQPGAVPPAGLVESPELGTASRTEDVPSTSHDTPQGSEDVLSTIHSHGLSSSTEDIMATISSHDLAQGSKGIMTTTSSSHDPSLRQGDTLPSTSALDHVPTLELVEEDLVPSTKTILNVTPRQQKKHKRLNKTDVMPTWAATKSLMQSRQVPCTNSEVIAPLFKTPPTDYGTLYSVLTLTQEISAVVVGPQRKTVITLDLDLYERALKIQQSLGKNQWVLRAGELHICFAALHALGKYLEGSGLDTVAVETGVYSPAALRGIYTGKAFKRGVEYHLMNALACFTLMFDALFPQMPPDSNLPKMCEEFKSSLHQRSDNITDIYNALASRYVNKIDPKRTDLKCGEMAQFLINYMTQVECLLHIISACRQGDWEAYLAALDNQIKYFFVHDLHNYARLMPVHLAQMNQLEKDDHTTWMALKEGNFCVKKSATPFTALFADQALEQKIKDLKGVGGLVGITQDDVSLDRLIITLPHITSLVNRWLRGFPRFTTRSHSTKEHYQLSGDIALRSSRNAIKLRDSIHLHCEGNPFIEDTPLKSIVSSALIPESAKKDILKRDERGLHSYQTFVQERLLQESAKSVWDVLKKVKLKSFSNWMEKTRVKVGDKVIKLREERQLLSRFLIIQQSRPELVPRLPATIGDYELAVTPRSMFASDGSLLIPTDKAAITHAIEEAKPIQSETQYLHQPSRQTPMPSVTQGPVQSPASQVFPGTSMNTSDEKFDHVIILDGMAVVQSIKKGPGMKKITDFKEAFVKKVTRLVEPYEEGRLIFDRYDITQSLKQKTRMKRAQGKVMEFVIHEQMEIAKITLKELLSSSKTKAGLTQILGDAVLEAYQGSKKKIIVVKDTTVLVNQPYSIPEWMSTHNHEEADTMIPLHVIDSVRDSSLRKIDVWSPDTDVLILLMDLVAHERLDEVTKLQFLTGKGQKYRKIDIFERVSCIGREKCKGLIGLHNFTGADWGGKFVGVSKKSWINSYLSLADSDPIISTFQLLGEGKLKTQELVDGELPTEVRPTERFLCLVYKVGGPTTIPELRWELFRSRKLEGEKLPPTRATLMPHILRANVVAMRDKSYTDPHPCLLPLDENGWVLVGEEYIPIKCFYKPAPVAVIELTKCGCRTTCSGQCSCKKNNLPCTPLCKCYNRSCTNIPDYKLTEDEEEDET